MNGATAAAKVLVEQGIDRVFTFPGGTIAPLYDAIANQGIEIICARHEQGAGYMALAVARLTGRPQVVLVTSGPGATNLLTVVADAFFDSTPLVAITGQVGTADVDSERPVRQVGFQQIDCPAMMKPVTKATYQPKHPDQLAAAVVEAFATTTEGRHGPVVLDISMDVQLGPIATEAAVDITPQVPAIQPTAESVAQTVALLSGAEKPAILAGQGIITAGATEELRRFASAWNIPVVTSLLGVGATAGKDPLSLGFMGHTGNQYAALTVHNADVVCVLGARLDIRITGSEVKDVVPAGKVIRVDIDDAELAYPRIPTDLDIKADVKEFLTALNQAPVGNKPADLVPWHAAITEWRHEFALSYDTTGIKIKPQAIITAADDLTSNQDVVVTTGVGSHQHWVARHFNFDYPSRAYLTSGGHGAMGYDLPSAIGAALARPGATVLCIVGDGSFQLNIQELQTIVDLQLPVKILVLDNERLALVSQFQLLNWTSDPTTGDKTNPNFAAIAEAYGIKGWVLNDPAQIEATLKKALNHPGPALVHCYVDPAEDVYPMLMGGQKLNEMSQGKK